MNRWKPRSMYRIVARIGLLCAALIPLPSLAADKAHVQVALLIDQPALRSFSAADLAWLEAEGARLIALKLAGEVSFLDFGTQPATSAYRLVFHLDDLDPSHRRSVPDVVYHVKLTGEIEATLTRGQWVFRPSDDYLRRRGDREQFLEELRTSIERASVAALHPELLSKIPVSREALVWNQPRGWAIAHKPADLCFAAKTRLRVETTIDDNGIPVPAEFLTGPTPFTPNRPPPTAFRGGLFLRPDPSNQDGLDRYAWTQTRAVEAQIYVERYQKVATGCRVAPAAGAPRSDP